jgi:hypothetical protein
MWVAVVDHGRPADLADLAKWLGGRIQEVSRCKFGSGTLFSS